MAREQALHEDSTNHQAANVRLATGDALAAGGMGGSSPLQEGYDILFHCLHLRLRGADRAAAGRQLPRAVRTPAILTRQIILSIRSCADTRIRSIPCI